jgi:hypothetical protein
MSGLRRKVIGHYELAFVLIDHGISPLANLVDLAAPPRSRFF